MSWTLDKKREHGVWMCSQYTDLHYAEINNLAEYGEPMSPYEPGFDQDFEPDFGDIIVEMPQKQVMEHGYGRRVVPTDFQVVRNFLYGLFGVPPGIHDFDGLVRCGFAKPSDRRISSNLYGYSAFPHLDSGEINSGDAAYIHGSVGFALMKPTRFINAQHFRRVDAEIGAGNDNWDFNSGNPVVNFVDGMVAALLGPDHYNLTAPIQLRYTGRGRQISASFTMPSLSTRFQWPLLLP